MKRLHPVLAVFYAIIMVSCGPSKSEAELAYNLQQYNEIKEIIKSQNYRFSATIAYPLQTNAVVEATDAIFRGTENVGSRIVLEKDNSYLNFSTENVEGRLPYYGEVQTGYYADTRSTAIEFNTTPQSMEIIENDKNSRVLVRFVIKNGTEQFNVKMDVFTNKRAVVQVYGANRTSIRYEGSIDKLPV